MSIDWADWHLRTISHGGAKSLFILRAEFSLQILLVKSILAFIIYILAKLFYDTYVILINIAPTVTAGLSYY